MDHIKRQSLNVSQIVAYSVPLRKRPMYTGFIGAMYGIASVAGPLLGGVFTDKGKRIRPLL